MTTSRRSSHASVDPYSTTSTCCDASLRHKPPSAALLSSASSRRWCNTTSSAEARSTRGRSRSDNGTATIAPGTGTSCFAGKKFCANGNVPADDKSGAGLGWNISQAMGSSTQTKVPVTTAVTIKFAGVPSGSRIQLSASSTVSYCYSLTDAEITAGTASIPYASFKTECWGTTGMAYDGVVAIEAIQIAIPGSTAGAAKAFDFCVTDIEPG